MTSTAVSQSTSFGFPVLEESECITSRNSFFRRYASASLGAISNMRASLSASSPESFSIGLIRRRLDLLKYLRNLDESLFCSFFLTRSIAQYTCRITWNLSATITALWENKLWPPRGNEDSYHKQSISRLFWTGNCEKYRIRSFSNRFGKMSITLCFSASTMILLYFLAPGITLEFVNGKNLWQFGWPERQRI